MVRENMRSPRAVLHFDSQGWNTSGWVGGCWGSVGLGGVGWSPALVWWSQSGAEVLQGGKSWSAAGQVGLRGMEEGVGFGEWRRRASTSGWVGI